MNASENFYGIGMGIINFATILGALMIGIFAKKLRMQTAYRLSIVIALLILPMALSVAAFFMSLGFFPAYILFIGCAVPIAAILTVLSIFVITAVQKKTPNENLGKVMAIITAAAQCAAPVGQVMYGVFFGVFSSAVYLPTLFASAAMFVMALVVQRLFRNEKVGVQNVWKNIE
jgi:MFS family permease